MALDKASLKSAIITTMENSIAGGPTAEQTSNIAALADDLANAIDTFVKSGTVSTTVAFPIAVQVTPATGTGATTATGSGSGSIS